MQYIQIEKKSGLVTAHINRGKVNALNHGLVTEIRTLFKGLQEEDETKGVVLAGKPGYFSAGLDLIELYEYDESEIKSFFTDFGWMHIELVRFMKPFVCAITGHSPAGGTVIAVAADQRIMCEEDRYKIGLNEVSLNIQITNNLISAYNFWLGRRQSYQNIMAGKLLTPTEALQQGLINQKVPMEEVIPIAQKSLKRIAQADSQILQTTKYKLRKDWLNQLENGIEEELEALLKIWWRPDIRMMMKMYIDSFSSRKS